jgi:hypothetical protein
MYVTVWAFLLQLNFGLVTFGLAPSPPTPPTCTDVLSIFVVKVLLAELPPSYRHAQKTMSTCFSEFRSLPNLGPF